MPNRLKRCTYCKQRSDQSGMVKHPAGWFCDQEHAVKYGREGARKKDDELHKRRKRAFYEKDIKTRREAAVYWFNLYIRLRDSGDPCISCGVTDQHIKYDAGHFVAAGSCSSLRFNEWNAHRQCVRCNRYLSGNLREYRPRLAEKVGESAVRFLEGPQPTIKITAQWYKSIEDKYKAKCKQLEAEAA